MKNIIFQVIGKEDRSRKSYAVDIKEACQYGMFIVKDQDGIPKQPNPTCMIHDAGVLELNYR